MQLFEIIFIVGAIIGTGFFNLAIGVLTKICNKPFYAIKYDEVMQFLFARKDKMDSDYNQIMRFKLYMFIALFGMFISFISGFIQSVLSN